MIIREIAASHFASWEHSASITLPETGVVVVTGPNGAGKSTLVEVIAHAVFGKSVRGAWCWQDTTGFRWGSEAQCTTDRINVRRVKRGSSSPSVAVLQICGVVHGYDTTKKAQNAIEAEVGDFDTWQRCHVFSSHDAVHFTLATDKERKQLLEGLLGLAYFDEARTHALTKHVGEVQRLMDLNERRSAVRRSIEVTHQSLALLDEQLNAPGPTLETLIEPVPPTLPAMPALPEKGEPPSEPPPIPPLDSADDGDEPVAVTDARAALTRTFPLVEAVRYDVEHGRVRHRACTDSLAAVSTRLAQLDQELEAWDRGACPTCAQTVEEALRAQLVGARIDARATLRIECATLKRDLAAIEDDLAELCSEEVQLAARRGGLIKTVEDFDRKRQAWAAHRHALVRQHEQAVTARRREHETALARYDLDYTRACQTIEDAWRLECDRLNTRYVAECASFNRMAAQQEHVRQHYAQQRAQIEEQHQAAMFQLTQDILHDHNLHTECVQTEQRVSEYDMVREVLGPKGVRAHILGTAMEGIQTVANTWLSRFGTPGQAIRLAEEGAALALSLSTARRPAWHAYKAASGGERRRVDVAIILALSEVARAARGRARGTMFFDEVFDALDDDGVRMVSEVIEELGSDRCVVVITHNGLLAQALNADLALRVEDGCITVV